ncbi:MAG: NFACT family protein [Clostridia bacterium]|nr:NFACT family protein [Clostridia bacterium]
MALDGIVLNRLVNEIKSEIVNKKVNKIYLHNSDNIIFNIRDNNLLLSSNPSFPRLYLSQSNLVIDEKQSNFVINLRKYLQGGIISDISTCGLDRIVTITFDALNDFKEKVTLRLILEVMGKYSNMILVDSNDIIIDSAKHITNFISSKRTIMPKIKYVRVIDDEKFDITEIVSSDELKNKTIDAIYNVYNNMIGKDNKYYFTSNLIRLFTEHFLGISKVVAESYVLSNVGNSEDMTDDEIKKIDVRKVIRNFIDYVIEILNSDKDEKDNEGNNKISYKIYFDKDTPKDFHIINNLVSFNKYDNKEYDSLCDLINKFYDKRATNNSLKCKSQDLKTMLTNVMNKDIKKKQIHHRVINESKDNDINKMYGDLIYANLYQMHKGDKELVCCNFYDGNLEITIPLDDTLSPQDNANRYYKKYNKTKSALKNSILQLEEIDKEIVYLETVISYLDNANSISDIETIRAELEQGGYLKRKLLILKGKNKLKGTSKKEKELSVPHKFVSSDGYEIYVGKNNLQNDEITFKVGKDSDVWLHVQDIPGSHVIIKTNGTGLDGIPDNTLLEAAYLGVYFSKGRESTKVAIDYVERRYVKKPSGSKPGFVIFVNNKTLFITPDKEILKRFNIEI